MYSARLLAASRLIGPGYRSHQMLTFPTLRVHLSFARGYLGGL
jgi:hypothetical protein